MIRRLKILFGSIAVVTCLCSVAGAQAGPSGAAKPAAPQDAPSRPAPKPIIPVRVQVVISRYEGDKKTSSLPYMLSVDANGQQTTLNMGIRVPVISATMDRAAAGPTTSYNYQNVGTSISCTAAGGEGGVFDVWINLDDSSLYDKQTTGGIEKLAPVFQSFSTSTHLLLHDGQMQQFTSATDKVSGEVVKIEVTLTGVK